MDHYWSQYLYDYLSLQLLQLLQLQCSSIFQLKVFEFPGHKCAVSVHALIIFGPSKQLYFNKTALKTPLCTTCPGPNSRLGEQLAAKEPNMSLRSWQRPKTELNEWMLGGQS